MTSQGSGVGGAQLSGSQVGPAMQLHPEGGWDPSGQKAPRGWLLSGVSAGALRTLPTRGFSAEPGLLSPARRLGSKESTAQWGAAGLL